MASHHRRDDDAAAAVTSGDAAAAAAAETLAPLLKLSRAADQADRLGRHARAVELHTRALSAAEATFPHDSLVLAWCTRALSNSHTSAAVDNNIHGDFAPVQALYADGGALQGPAQRSVALLHARWRAGTLFTLTPVEAALCEAEDMSAMWLGAHPFLSMAHAALVLWPAASSAAELETRLHGLYGALRAVLEARERCRNARPHVVHVQVALYLDVLLEDNADLLPRLRSVCGMSSAEEASLRRFRELSGIPAAISRSAHRQATGVLNNAQAARAAADVARFGLRACALPDCNAVEPQPKAFKVCGRCRTVVYCSAAHQAEDWKRHKKHDGCSKASA
jgi:hypothetical protein